MIEAVHLISRPMLDASLRNACSDGVEWPVDRDSLAVLIDLGLSNGQIGQYFGVGPDDVHMLREDYGFF